jgi:hypothetical protein
MTEKGSVGGQFQPEEELKLRRGSPGWEDFLVISVQD